MRKERILAVIMSVLLALSMISATVFAAEIPALDGKLKIQGTAAEGRTLSAEFKEVKPEGVTEDDVAYLWERKTVEDEETEKGVKATEIAKDGIAVIVNKNNTTDELSADQVKSIYTGDATTWDEVVK